MAGAASAQTPALAPATVRISMETTAGPIVLDLEAERAPKTTANFLAYVDQHRLDGTVFYRAMVRNADSGLIQGGVGSNPDRVLPPVAHEPTTQTGLSHTDGVISLARFAPGSARRISSSSSAT
jgi:peptidyl-prolyl cis-trans isomerase A (cyclophilin A)